MAEDNKYTVTQANGYTFKQDSSGTIVATGDIKNEKASRNNNMQRQAGGTERLSNDDGGHLFGAAQGGPAKKENLTAQDRDLNRKTMTQVERAERTIASDPNNKVSSERIAFVSANKTETGMRPDAYMINDHIVQDGKEYNVNLSFQNASPAEQESWNQAANTVDLQSEHPNTGDKLRESMTAQEYAQLMNETENDLPNISDEFSVPSNAADSSTSNGSDNNSGGIDNDSGGMGM